MRKIKNSRSMKVLSAALLGVAALGTPAVAETVTVSPDMDGTELSNLNQMKTEDVRNFNFNSSDETYTVTKNLGTSTAGEININGIIGETAKSVIDLNTNKGFVLNGDTTLNISNIEFKNAYTTSDGSVLDINKGTVNLTNVDFTNNVSESSSEHVDGGVIYNEGSLGDISGIFKNNGAVGKGSKQGVGGVICNGGTIGNITADFIGNYATSDNESVSGGTIFNATTIGNITGDFIDNYALATLVINGGVIRNDGTVETIKGNFTGNWMKAKQDALGGAIYNKGTIQNINSDFIDNRAESDTSISGVAICNWGTINTISGVFSDNYSLAKTEQNYGTALFNGGTIEKLHSSFVNNIGEASTSYSAGTLVNYTNAKIREIEGDFIGNKLVGATYAHSSGLYNWGTIDNIKSNFTGNRAEAGTWVLGGTLRNDGTIKSITGDFSDNYSSAGTYNYGTTLYNDGTIEKLDSSFINNTGEANTSYAVGTLTNVSSGKIGEIVGDFIGNKLTGATFGFGAGIYNYGTIDYVSSNFENNTLTAGTYVRGGALMNVGTINNITGVFLDNYSSAGTYNYGATLFNDVTIEKLHASFINNTGEAKTSYAGGTLTNSGEIGEIVGDFIGNKLVGGTFAYGAGLFNSGTIGSIAGNFLGNSTEASTTLNGGTIRNGGTITSIEGDFTENRASAGTGMIGGTLRNDGTIKNLHSSFINNIGESKTSYVMGTLANLGNISELAVNFLNNSIKTSSETHLALGGAVFSERVDLNFTADNRQSIFSGNTTEDYRGKLPNAIFVRTNKIDSSTGEETFYNPTITLKATNNGSFIFDDTIDGGEISSDWTELKREHQYNLSLTGDKSGKININNNIYNANISNDYVTTNISNPYNLSNNHNSLTVNSGTLNLGSLSTAPVMFESFAIKGGNINIGNVDVDLATKTMGRITANTYGESSNKGSVNVQSFNLLSDGENLITPVEFADKTFKNTVKSNIKEAYTKLYRYDVSYDTSNKYGENGYFIFQRGGSSSGNPSDAFNPAVLSTPITAQAGAQASITETFRYVFEHADAFTQLPSVERLSHINANQYALSTDYNNNLGPIATEFNNKAGWFRPYVTFENMNLKNGPKVDAVTYGSLVGFDSDFQKLGKGWSGLTTGYIGYNGSQLNYKGVDTTMNGGILGLTQTFYKGNFWSALTLSAGASVGQTSTMYGKEDFTSLLAGVGSKTGYNFEFKQGKFIVQPIMFMSYTFVNTFDYTNAAGVKINSDPMHTIQLNPSVRFIANTKTGWQPYASVGMVWNLLNETNATANGVKLPEMSMKPYVEYGLGLQRNWKDKFIAFGQAMIRNGGRNGIALTFGFRWALGKDSKPIEKVQGVNVKKLTMGNPSMPNIGGKVPTTANRTVLKQLTPTPKTALGTKPQNTTRTTNSAILKQL